MKLTDKEAELLTNTTRKIAMAVLNCAIDETKKHFPMRGPQSEIAMIGGVFDGLVSLTSSGNDDRARLAGSAVSLYEFFGRKLCSVHGGEPANIDWAEIIQQFAKGFNPEDFNVEDSN